MRLLTPSLSGQVVSNKLRPSRSIYDVVISVSLTSFVRVVSVIFFLLILLLVPFDDDAVPNFRSPKWDEILLCVFDFGSFNTSEETVVDGFVFLINCTFSRIELIACGILEKIDVVVAVAAEVFCNVAFLVDIFGEVTFAAGFENLFVGPIVQFTGGKLCRCEQPTSLSSSSSTSNPK